LFDAIKTCCNLYEHVVFSDFSVGSFRPENTGDTTQMPFSPRVH
jgi:hypothetical protein